MRGFTAFVVATSVSSLRRSSFCKVIVLCFFRKSCDISRQLLRIQFMCSRIRCQSNTNLSALQPVPELVYVGLCRNVAILSSNLGCYHFIWTAEVLFNSENCFSSYLPVLCYHRNMSARNMPQIAFLSRKSLTPVRYVSNIERLPLLSRDTVCLKNAQG